MTFIVLVLVLAIVVALLTRRFRYLNKLKYIPGPKAYPLVGNAMDLVVPANRLVELFLTEYFSKYNQIFTLWMGPVPAVFVFQPQHMQVILGKGKHLDKPFIYMFPKKWVGTGLLTSTGRKWQTRRKLIDPSFHLSLLENFLCIFCENSRKLVKDLQKHENSGQAFDAYALVTKCTLNIICETAMGTQIKMNDQKEDLTYMEAVHEGTVLLMERILRPWLYPDFIYWKTRKGKKFLQCVDVIHGFTDKVLLERKLQRKNSHLQEHSGSKKKMAFLDMMLEVGENNGALTDNDIREEVNTFMVTGHHTSTATICWVLQMLGSNTHLQEKAHEELDHIFQDSDRSPTMKDLNDMKYLERVIKETLRLYPVLPTIARTLSEEVRLDGYTLPAGLMVFLPSFLTHRLPEYFPEPERFDPDRFLPENVANRHPYAYIPFSAGPRNCIGQKFALLEVKTVLSFVLRRFKVRAVKEKLTPIVEVTMKPEEGFNLTLSSRNSSF